MFNRRQLASQGARSEAVGGDALETYHPKMLVRQQRLGLEPTTSKEEELAEGEAQGESRGAGKTATRWLPRLSGPPSLRARLTQKMARLSSLDSTRSSSTELDSSDPSQAQVQQKQQVMPLISITSNHGTPSLQQQQRQRRLKQYADYYGRSRAGKLDDEEEDEEDEFDEEDPPLSVPYTSASSWTNVIGEVRQQVGSGSRLEELLDDRQGMNSGEQQFTKAEKLNRASIDGSILNEALRLDEKAGASSTGAAASSGGKQVAGSRKERHRRSKSPSSSSVGRARRGHQRRGLLGLAARLTRKHESIARLQLSILNSGLVSLKTMDRELASLLPKPRMSPKEFEERVKLMRKYEVLATIEYRFASRYETYVCRHALQESNEPKNSYKKCIPYDYNRVVLKTLPNVPDSDYINASHVDSLLKPNAYIVAQGPNENTIQDFWRMIWEQKTFVVVMLTKVFDFIRVMCNQYWPVELNKPERYGNLEVTLLYEEPLADFVIRTIKLARLKTSDAPQKAAEGGPAGDEAKDAKDEDEEEEEDLSDDEDDYSDGSSANELVLSQDFAERSLLDAGQQADRLPPVRAPKYASRPRVRRTRHDSDQGRPRPPRTLSDTPGSPSLFPPRSSSQPPESPSGRGPRTPTNWQPPNEFLHPLFMAGAQGRAASSGSLEPGTPLTPMSPRTPSTAGLDRSSATRKAVKKKKRARAKRGRPTQTHFQAPDKSQLADDDDENPEDSAQERIIYQFHYSSWASHTCPFISSLLHFRRRVRICMDEMSKSGKTGPTVVHCNDGCGRAGTYLCIDANLDMAEEDNVYDVYNYTKKMRQSRKFLIENLEQYKFIYDTLEEAMFCGKTWFPVSELHKRLKMKSQRNPITKKNEYLREYEKITRMTSKFSIGDCAGGHRVENREKNRDVSTVPPDDFRPYLSSFQSNDKTDYINAVFVDGYTRSKEYIVTEWPMHKTISDFWSLLYDHDCNSVILLANPTESYTYPSFLPSEKERRRRFGLVFSAELINHSHQPNIKSWIYTIYKKNIAISDMAYGFKPEPKTTQVFQITCWPQGHRVPTSTKALVELMNTVERWRQRTTYGPVCVVSLDGKSRAGVYCAANVAIEQVVQHSEVDVFQAVKTVRRHRPQLIENMTEYKYCYDLILHYVINYLNQNPTHT